MLGGGGDLGIFGDDDLTPDMFEAPDAPLGLPPAPRPEPKSGPQGGRPRGSRNKSTQEWVRYLGSRYQSPLVGLAETWSRPPRQLAEELGLVKTVVTRDAEGNESVREVVDVAAAVAMQQQARIAALPYWHQKLPMAIEIKEERLGMMVIQGFSGPDSVPAGGLRLDYIDNEENQQLSATDDGQSHGSRSHVDAKPLENNDDPLQAG
jgi:hypothetical protein